MNKNQIKHKYIMVVVLLLSISILTNVEGVYAANYKTDITKKSLIMYTNMSKVIKITNPSSKVKWTTSNKKIVSLLGTRGDNDSILTFKTGKKTGTCKIKATVGEKVFTCNVTVKKDTKISRATLVKAVKTKNAVKVKVALSNKTRKTVEFGEAFWVERFEDGKWKKLKMKEDVAFMSIAYVIPAKRSAKKTYTLTYCYDLEDFTKGVYRIHVEANYKEKYNYVIFNIK
ncbi:MAG: hypothetical protein HDT30_14115 [Clostridiales bacterium]|nr:hypothetical protein [Clostridiales bacterium]